MKYKYFMLRCINLLLIVGFLAAYEAVVYIREQSAVVSDLHNQVKNLEEERNKLYSAVETHVGQAVKQQEAAAAGDYRDGSYEGAGTGFGGTIRVRVTVEQQKITAVEILEAGGEDSAYLTMAEGVIDTVIETQSCEVDCISGATYSSGGILEAVENALKGAAKDDQAK